VLLYAALEIPEIPTAPGTLACLLDRQRPEVPQTRLLYRPIHQAHFGTHDLTFGSAFYQPERTGYNDVADVARLAEYLGGIECGNWTAAHLHALSELVSDAERQEEL